MKRSKHKRKVRELENELTAERVEADRLLQLSLRLRKYIESKEPDLDITQFYTDRYVAPMSEAEFISAARQMKQEAQAIHVGYIAELNRDKQQARAQADADLAAGRYTDAATGEDLIAGLEQEKP